MIKCAKVSLSAVNAFMAAAASARDISNKFDGGKACIEAVEGKIQKHIKELREGSSSLDRAAGKVEEKISRLKEVLATYYSRVSELEDELGEVEEKLYLTPSEYTVYDEEGNESSIPNPTYSALVIEESRLQAEVLSLEAEINEYERQLGHAQDVYTRVISTIDSIESIIYSIEEKKDICQRLETDLQDVKQSNYRKSSVAVEKLAGIEKAIEKYLEVKMKMDSSLGFVPSEDVSVEHLINININIQKINVVKEEVVKPVEQVEAVVVEETDDNGKVYRIGDELIKNERFMINGYEYETDNLGRTISASGKLSINTLGQKNRAMTDSIDVIGKGDEQEGDDRGHLIGHQFIGSDELENMVPQNFKINRGAYRKLEDSLATKVREGHEVWVNVIPFFSKESHRPDGIFYFYRVDNEPRIVLFPNEIAEV